MARHRPALENCKGGCLSPCWCAGLPASAPMQTALTGLELLLARAQLWQDTAALHVSLARQLERLSRLALRWRRLQLAERHAEGFYPGYSLAASCLLQLSCVSTASPCLGVSLTAYLVLGWCMRWPNVASAWLWFPARLCSVG